MPMRRMQASPRKCPKTWHLRHLSAQRNLLCGVLATELPSDFVMWPTYGARWIGASCGSRLGAGHEANNRARRRLIVLGEITLTRRGELCVHHLHRDLKFPPPHDSTCPAADA